MKRLAIITLYDDINFGNKLQNYATQEFFKGRGFDVETIPYVEERHPHRTIKNRIHRILNLLLVKCGFRRIEKLDPKIDEYRRECIRGFSSEYLSLASEISYRRIPSGFSEMYDYFVTGSDQVWRVWNDDKYGIRFFLLMFVPPEKRLTMSPSFGLNYVERKYYSLYKEGLEGFKKISVREKEGRQIVRQICGRDSIILLDPTMLIHEETWVRIQKRPELFIDEDYILVYLLGGYSKHQSEIESISKTTGLKIVNLFEKSLYVNTRPDEFLYWIRKAKLVITDSFHATVFSILFRADFIVFVNNNPGMSNRLTTLLDLFGLQNRGYMEQQEIDNDDLFRTDFRMVETVLCEERGKADQFYSNIS